MIKIRNFGKKQSMEITSLKDERLIYIDPRKKGFYDIVLGYSSYNENVQKFLKLARVAKSTPMCPFWKPIYDPSFDGHTIVFEKGKLVAVGHTFKWWRDMARNMSTVQGKRWSIGTSLSYTVFLVWVVNNLVEHGYSIDDAIHAVAVDSSNLGVYYNNLPQYPNPELAGICEVLGVYDLGGHFKLLTSPIGGFFEAGGAYIEDSNKFPLAHMEECYKLDSKSNLDTAWFILLDR